MKSKKIIAAVIIAVGFAVAAASFSVAVSAQVQKPIIGLRLIPDQYGTEVKPGEGRTFLLEIKNLGDRALTGIRLSAGQDEGWVIKFDPAAISSISAGNFQNVTVTIIPDPKADRGNYDIVLVAAAAEAQESIHLWLRIEQSSGVWLWTGGAIAVIVVAVFAFIFMKSSKQ